MKQSKVCLVTPSLMSVRFFLVPHIAALSQKYDLTLVANVHDAEYLKRINLPIRVVHIPLERKISLHKDLKALFMMIKFFLSENFAVVHTIAPKAGIVGILAAYISRVPKRLHIFQGEVWVTKKGLKKAILKNVDRIMAFFATHLLVVSESERYFLVKQKVISAKKSSVLASGSICGVDMNRFKPDNGARSQKRVQLGINETDIIILYVGRLTRDKGVAELITAFSLLEHVVVAHTHLVVVGPDEEGILQTIKLSSEVQARVHFLPYTEAPEQFMAASDLLVLPSHREGFGLVILEAAAVKVPTIGSRIYGITDAILYGQTGLLFEPEDVTDLTAKMKTLIMDESLRKQMGEAAYLRCKKNFTQQIVVAAMLQYYEENLISLGT